MHPRTLPALLAVLTVTVLTLASSARSETAAVINFSKGSYSLGEQGKQTLGGLYQRLAENSGLKVAIHGYCDSSGADDLNQNMSGARAQYARDLLLRLGLSPERVLEAKGFGRQDPVADNATEEGRQQNRRVELLVSGAAPVATPQPTPVPTSAPVAAAEPLTPAAAPLPTAVPAPAPAPAAQTTAQVPAGQLTRFALGIGYPDLRARVALGLGIDAEAKFSFEDGFQMYSGRLYWNFADLGPLKLMAGAEGGYAQFDGVETLSGNGALAGGFVGAEYQFSQRLRLSLDAGPAWLQASSEGQTYSTTELIYNTALYFYIF